MYTDCFNLFVLLAVKLKTDHKPFLLHILWIKSVQFFTKCKYFGNGKRFFSSIFILLLGKIQTIWYVIRPLLCIKKFQVFQKLLVFLDFQ